VREQSCDCASRHRSAKNQEPISAADAAVGEPQYDETERYHSESGHLRQKTHEHRRVGHADKEVH
jgi:hypothetical protein